MLGKGNLLSLYSSISNTVKLQLAQRANRFIPSLWREARNKIHYFKKLVFHFSKGNN